MMKIVFVILATLALNFTAYAAEDVAKVPAAAVTTAVPVVAEAATGATADANVTEATQVAATTAAESAKLAEDQIPLSIEANKKATENNSSATKAMMSMVIVLILLASSYYFVKRYKFSNKINKSNTRIQVLSQHYLGPKKSLAIIHVAGESILVGVTDHNISMIKSLSLIDDEVPANLPNNFGQTMDKVEGGGQAAQAAAGQTTAAGAGAMATKAYELDEEFSFANVTDTVSKKIKSMRSFS